MAIVRFHYLSPFTIKSWYVTLIWCMIVIFALSVTINEIFAIEIGMTLTWPLEWTKAKCKYSIPNPRYDFVYDGNNYVFSYLSLFARYLQLKYAWLWPWPFEWAKVKGKYANRKPRHDFVDDGMVTVMFSFFYLLICKHANQKPVHTSQ